MNAALPPAAEQIVGDAVGVGLGGAQRRQGQQGQTGAAEGSRQQAAYPRSISAQSQPTGPGPGSLSMVGSAKRVVPSEGGLGRFLCKRPCLAEAGLVAPTALEAEDAAAGWASRDADLERSPSPQGQDLLAGISAAVAMPDWSAFSLLDDPEAELLLAAAAKDPALRACQTY